MYCNVITTSPPKMIFGKGELARLLKSKIFQALVIVNLSTGFVRKTIHGLREDV